MKTVLFSIQSLQLSIVMSTRIYSPKTPFAEKSVRWDDLTLKLIRRDAFKTYNNGMFCLRTSTNRSFGFCDCFSASGALLHLIKSSLGSGILAMPNAFKNGGLIFGLFGTAAIGALCTHCIYLLVSSWRRELYCFRSIIVDIKKMSRSTSFTLHLYTLYSIYYTCHKKFSVLSSKKLIQIE